jgi:hypothetical protein
MRLAILCATLLPEEVLSPMLLSHHFRIQAAILQAQMSGQAEQQVRAACDARRLYQRTRTEGRLRKLWSLLTRRPRYLLDLRDVERVCRIGGRGYAGTQTVCLADIRGSAGRCRDFDDEFHPLLGENSHRWLSIACAQRMHVPLPPVKLIRVGDVYFVEDGHHRISVARALGQQHIDAEVVVWHVKGPLLWEKASALQMAKALPALWVG